jgi:hypothetical protein
MIGGGALARASRRDDQAGEESADHGGESARRTRQALVTGEVKPAGWAAERGGEVGGGAVHRDLATRPIARPGQRWAPPLLCDPLLCELLLDELPCELLLLLLDELP